MSAAAEVLEPCGIRLGLKWPNDLVAYKQNWRGKSLVKIGGIIGEQKNDHVILGMGLNIFYAPELPERAIPPASLASLGAVNVPEMIDLAKRVLSAWQNLETQRMPAFRWPECGDAIRWEDGCGTCQGWESDGRLSILTESGIVLLASGDVSGVIASQL
jgi:biotin-(acetyl-CoA carboxylase) ligase